MIKKCKKCKISKEETEYQIDRRRKDGLYNWCKQCKKEYDLVYRKSDKVKKYYSSSEYKYKKQKYSKYIAETNPEMIIYIQCKARAKRQNIPFNLDLSDIIIPSYCPILGIELKHNRTGENGGKAKPNSPSIDKFDNSKGYVKGNIWIISYKANAMKNNASIEELKLFCNKILEKINDNNILCDDVEYHSHYNDNIGLQTN